MIPWLPLGNEGMHDTKLACLQGRQTHLKQPYNTRALSLTQDATPNIRCLAFVQLCAGLFVTAHCMLPVLYDQGASVGESAGRRLRNLSSVPGPVCAHEQVSHMFFRGFNHVDQYNPFS